MPDIRLAKLPDGTPIKLSIAILPELNLRLIDYAAFYRATYGSDEPVTELVPAMLAAFLDSDRAFSRGHRSHVQAERS